jgi:exopolysaccharide biosynthesis polyprenyl glycosylphosphotransferase
VGSGDLAKEVALKIRSHLEFGFNVVGLLARDPKMIGKNIAGANILGAYKDLKAIIKKMTIDQVIFALPAKEDRLMRALLGEIEDEGIDIKVVPDLNPFYTLRKGIEELDGLTVISLRDTPMYGWHTFLKRTTDIFFSLVAIIIFSPFMCLIIFLIRISSEGPIFYTQTRVSLDGRIFKMIKFRTMKKDAEKETGAVWAKVDDPRKTKIGAVLRKTSIDELPQLFNVLIGDMSLVGPRPERPELVENFLKRIPHYALRHKIKGGMTGWAQIHGWRGDTDLNTRIQYDLYYIEHWSFWLDMQILFRTIPAVLKSKGAY